jgi:hypothetical protein
MFARLAAGSRYHMRIGREHDHGDGPLPACAGPAAESLPSPGVGSADSLSLWQIPGLALTRRVLDHFMKGERSDPAEDVPAVPQDPSIRSLAWAFPPAWGQTPSTRGLASHPVVTGVRRYTRVAVSWKSANRSADEKLWVIRWKEFQTTP